MLDEKNLEKMIAPIVQTLNHLVKTVNQLTETVNEVQLTLENDTNKKINIIAEGHLDLTRKPDEALKVENEKEMLLLRVTSLENEVRRIKKRLEEIA